jgi:hypothetical protein
MKTSTKKLFLQESISKAKMEKGVREKVYEKIEKLNDIEVEELFEAYLLEIRPKTKTFFSAYGSPQVAAAFAPIQAAVTYGMAKKYLGMTGGQAALFSAGRALTSLALATIYFAAYRALRNIYDEGATKKCGMFKINTPKRQMCIFTEKVGRLERQIALTKAALNDANKIKDTASASKLKGKLQKKLGELQGKLAETKSTVSQYQAKYGKQ